MVTCPSYLLSVSSAAEIVATLHDVFDSVWAPVADNDGTYRLQRLDKDTTPSFGKLCRLPLKKLLLPAGETVWQSQNGSFQTIPVKESAAVIGLPLCELQGAWYLDQVFAEEEEYRQRRARLSLFGSPCEPTESCRCRNDIPFGGDYFISGERLWLVGDKQTLPQYLQNIVTGKVEKRPLALPEPMTEQATSCTAEQFLQSCDSTLWQEESKACLSCGACSAVCPTCYCFDMIDNSTLREGVQRQRVWDNCFFHEHGQVAGGYDFRASRAERLKFRYEHKTFGFGSLRGVNACTGCARCDQACPVGIRLERITEAILAEQAHGH